jgi:hypothetical protein
VESDVSIFHLPLCDGGFLEGRDLRHSLLYHQGLSISKKRKNKVRVFGMDGQRTKFTQWGPLESPQMWQWALRSEVGSLLLKSTRLALPTELIFSYSLLLSYSFLGLRG